MTKQSDRRSDSDKQARTSRVVRAATSLRVDASSIQASTHDVVFTSTMRFNDLKAAWCVGDWERIASTPLEDFSTHPDKQDIALIVASAQQHLGNHTKSKRSLDVAIEWGCSPKLIAQVLVSDAYNTLARAAALRGQTDEAVSHFRTAIQPSAGSEDMPILAQVRAMREMTRLGLIAEATAVFGRAVAEAKQVELPVDKVSARLEVLESELDLLNHELSLFQQRLSDPQHMLDTDHAARMRDLRARSTSQLGQDIWVLEMTSFKRGGFFVEFGATDGVLLSNTYLLEREFAWNGICAEPNPRFFHELQTNRKCKVAQDCIGGKSGEKVDFVFAGALGGMTRYADADLHAARRASYRNAGQVGEVITVSLDDFLRTNDAPRKIDYLSIDTEGSEFEILNAFPFDQWDISLLTVEHNDSDLRRPIFELLSRHGYQRTSHKWEDWYHRLR